MVEVTTTENAALPASASPERSPHDRAPELVRMLLMERPLYAKIEGDEALIEALDEILECNTPFEFDLYCIHCQQVTPWAIKPYKFRNSGGGAGFRYSEQALLPTIRVINAVCLRKQHFYTYILYRLKSFVQKVGQRPSMADIAHGELKAIRGLEEQDRKELGRALGLFSHDTPLGAFVYLRRVFERMIDRAHQRYQAKHGKPVEEWNDLRMNERIRDLGEEIPSEITSNSGVFGLLSKGIHELTDEDAEVLFPLVKAVILQILGDEDRHRQSEIARASTNKALQSAIARHKAPE